MSPSRNRSSNLLFRPLRLTRVSAPAVEPVTLTEAKKHLGLLDDSDDGYVTDLLAVARENMESDTRRVFISQQWDLFLEWFPAAEAAIELPTPPLISVDSITYVDEAGTTQTMPVADYEVDTATEPGRVRPVPNVDWPTTQLDRMIAVTVRFTAGYGAAASDVPAGIKHAMKLFIGHYFENRELTSPTRITRIPEAVDCLVARYRWGDYPL